MAEAIRVCILGRGKSGTRIPAQLLLTGDGYIGKVINASLDKTPFTPLYEAAALCGNYVQYCGNYEWDFSELEHMPLPQRFIDLIDKYLADIFNCNKQLCGWKLPETILTYPLLVRYLPDIHYIYWLRDPYSMLMKHHNTDDLAKYNIEIPAFDNWVEQRALSWLYQWQIVNKTPQPDHFLEVRYEDFMQNPETEIERMERFIGRPLGRIVVRQPEPNLPFKRLPFLDKALEESAYVTANLV